MTENPSEHLVSFEPENYQPVRLSHGSLLSEDLNISNSPLLFGCRTGVCGTCLIELLSQENGQLPGPSDDEIELLDLIAPGNPRARLACQIELSADIKIKYIGHGS